MFTIQRKPCPSCIYRKACGLDIATLEAEIADPHMPGFFVGYRICHHTPDTDGVCCAGFWRKHKDHFTAGQVAQRLGAVAYVQVDCFITRKDTAQKAHGQE